MSPARVTVPNRPDWHQHAACRGMGPDLFFPGPGELHLAQQARMICWGCPVIDECRRYAAENHEVYGVWAGRSVKQRRAVPPGEPPPPPMTRRCRWCHHVFPATRNRHYCCLACAHRGRRQTKRDWHTRHKDDGR